MKLFNEEGERIPATITTTPIPGGAFRKDLFSMYSTTRYYSVLEPMEPLPPGLYTLGGVSFRVSADEVTPPPPRPQHLSAKIVTRTTYVGYTAACVPHHEPRPFVRLAFQAPVKEYASAKLWVYEMVVYRQGEHGAKPGPSRTLTGLPAEIGPDGQMIVRIPVWWFKGMADEGKRILISLRAINQAGHYSEAIRKSLSSDALRRALHEVDAPEQETNYDPLDMWLAQDLERFIAAAASEEAERVFKMLEPTADVPDGPRFDQYFRRAVLSSGGVIEIFATVPEAPKITEFWMEVRIKNGQAYPALSPQQMKRVLSKIPTEDPTVDHISINAYWHEGQLNASVTIIRREGQQPFQYEDVHLEEVEFDF